MTSKSKTAILSLWVTQRRSIYFLETLTISLKQLLYFQVVVVRERDLLRLVLPGVTRARVNELKDQMSAAIASKGLRMQLHDSAHTAFYANPG